MTEVSSTSQRPAAGGGLGLPDPVRACLFDLDGVLTDTARVHAAAWEGTFNDYLQQRARDHQEPFVPFDPVEDYQRYVDGRPREDGVRTFLASRGIESGDAAALGRRKNGLFVRLLHAYGVNVFKGSRRYLRAAAAADMRLAVVSSSEHVGEVVAVAGLAEWLPVRVDGQMLRREGLAGKPAPDAYLKAAELLRVKPAEAAVFEDARSGIEAGRAGGFGYVVGVDRGGPTAAQHADQYIGLVAAGADIVVDDLADLLTESRGTKG